MRLSSPTYVRSQRCQRTSPRWLVALVALAVLGASLVLTPQAVDAQAVPQVVISEIHYHPQPVGVAFPDYDDRETTEFIELLNLETSAVDIGGWCLDRAVDFCFDAGTSLGASSTIVIADDPVAFDALHGFMPAGVYGGKLSNSGERVELITDTGVSVVDLTWGTANPWPVTPDGNGPSLELVSAAGDLASPASWAASAAVDGNPGSAPSLVSAVPPLVLSHTGAELVSAGVATAVTATAVNTTAMSLVYNVNWGANQTTAMTEVGGVWQANLPALSSGGFIQYRFEASGPGGTSVSPRVDDAIDWWAVGVASPQPNNVPVLDLFFSPQNWTNIDNKTCPCTGAVAYEGRIWTNVASRRAGFTSINQPKAHLRLDFPAAHPFEAAFLDSPVDELTLDAGFPNYDIVREQLSWQLMEQAGFPPVRSEHVRVHQQGSLQGLYLLREEQDGDWRSRHDLDRGAFYKVESWSPDTFGFAGLWTKKEGLDEPDTDIEALAVCTSQTGAALRSCLLDTVDVPQMINEFAAVVTTWQTDQREFNFFVYRDNTQNALWRMLPDDLDRTWGSHVGGSLLTPDVSSGKPYRRCVGTDPTPANEICRAFMNVPEFKDMYLRRIRTLADEVLADPIWHTRIANLTTELAADWADDDAKWNRTSFAFADIMSALDGFVTDYLAHLRAGGHENNIPGAQSSAPSITAVDYRSDPGDGLGYVLLSNPSTTESVDVSNWTFDGQVEIPEGVVILPGATVAVSTNDQAFRALNPSFTGVRAEAQGVLSGQVMLQRRDGTTAATIGQAPDVALILNEWNAVSKDNLISGGDSFFGSVAGNGGDWFELVVVEDNLDLRGWELQLTDSEGAAPEITDTFVFADQPELANVRAGTIITVSEDLADDVSFRPATGDWWINLQANSDDDGAFFTAASQSNFDTNNDDWQLRISDDAGTTRFGPVGEGIGGLSGVGSSEVGELEIDPNDMVTPLAGYDDGNASTFGAPNETAGVAQNFAPLRAWFVPDTTGPTTIIDAPYPGAELTNGIVELAGTAADETGVDAVQLQVQDTNSGLFLQPDATFAAASHSFDAVIDDPEQALTDWSLVATLPVGTYELSAMSTDVVGNAGEQVTRAFAIVDAEAPSTPTGLTVEDVTDSTVSLSWQPATDNVGVVAYEVRRDGSAVGTVAHPATNLTDSGLAADTSFTYVVVALDAGDNTSAASAPVVATTTSPPEVVALSEIADASWQTNGTVNAVLTVGDTVFIGGDFSELTDAVGTVVARSNLAAIDRVSNTVLPLDGELNNKVFAMTASPDGATVYVVGSFTSSAGVPRKRIAAFDVATGALTTFKAPSPNKQVQAVTTDGSTLYIGGLFTKVGGIERTRLAAIDLASATLNPGWTPVAGSAVNDLIVDGPRVWLAGNFKTIDGQPAQGIAAVDPVSGALLATDHATFSVFDIDLAGDQLFLAGNKRAVAFDRDAGTQLWSYWTNGKLRSVDAAGGFAYFGGNHTRIRGTDVAGLTRLASATGDLDDAWLPAVNGNKGVLTIAVDGAQVFVGGDFTTVGDDAHQGLASFSEMIVAPSPDLVSLTMLDGDNNGLVDTIEAVFDNALEACAPPCTAGWELTGVPSGGTLVSVTTAGPVATLVLAEGAGNPSTAVGALQVGLGAASELVDVDGATVVMAATAPEDGAAPVVLKFRKTNAGTTGLAEAGDTITTVWSEPVLDTSLPTLVDVVLRDPDDATNDQLLVDGYFAGPIDLGADDFLVCDEGPGVCDGVQAVFADSSIVLSGGNKTVTLTLGSCTASCDDLATGASATTLTYVAAPTITDLVDNGAVGSVTKTFKMF